MSVIEIIVRQRRTKVKQRQQFGSQRESVAGLAQDRLQAGCKGATRSISRYCVCLTPGNDPLTDKPRIDHVCISRGGLGPSSMPQVGTWEIPFLAGKPITDHSSVWADLDVI